MQPFGSTGMKNYCLNQHQESLWIICLFDLISLLLNIKRIVQNKFSKKIKNELKLGHITKLQNSLNSMSSTDKA
jgi:hypothetical protein